MILWTSVYVHRVSFLSLLMRCRMIGTRACRAHRLLGCHCRIGGLLKSEWSIGIGIDWADFNRNLLAKGGQNRFQNDEVAVNQ